MGIFDTLKQVGRYFTGGGAELHLQIDERFVDTESRLPVTIFCNVKEHELLIDALIVEVRALETTKVRVHNNTNNKHTSTQTRTMTATTYKNELIIDENFRLDPMGEYKWETEIILPAEREGTYLGINARHEWMVRAMLKKSGNNPNSQWEFFKVR